MPPYGDSEEFSLTQSLKGLSYDDVTKYHNEDALIRGRREDVEQFLQFVEAGDGKKAEKIRTVALARLLEFKRLRNVQEMANRQVRMAKPVYSARNYNLPPIVLPPIDFGNAAAAPAAAAAAAPAGGAGGPSGGPSGGSSSGPSTYAYEAEKHEGLPSGLEGNGGGPGRTYGGRRRQSRKTRSKSRKTKSKSRKSRRSRN
jgi:hypothetical protein